MFVLKYICFGTEKKGIKVILNVNCMYICTLQYIKTEYR